MRPRLRVPLRSQLADGFAEADVQRVWRGIRAPGARQRHQPRWYLASAAVAVLSICVAIVVMRGSLPSPLRLSSGDLPTMLALDERASARSLEFADGSRLSARAGTRLEVLANDRNLFLTALRRGRTHFDVHPGGPRRWIVECGEVTVEVVGTEFAIERTSDHVDVSVTRGVVVVRGESVPDHVQRIGAGEHLRVATPAVASDTVAPDVAAPSQANATASSRSVASEPDVAATHKQNMASNANGIRSNDTNGDRSNGANGANSDRSKVEALLGQAEAARRGGDTALAVRLLEEAAERASGTPAGAVAALTAARLLMQTAPARAERVLSHALAVGMPIGLEEDARARLVEARALSGDREGARAAARAYNERFPKGVHTEAIQQWVR